MRRGQKNPTCDCLWCPDCGWIGECCGKCDADCLTKQLVDAVFVFDRLLDLKQCSLPEEMEKNSIRARCTVARAKAFTIAKKLKGVIR
jgi:hypothetical protein